MKAAIFGSCVSRDTAEFMPEVEVVAYVARHSVTSLQSAHGTDGIDLGALSSAFQKRMVTSDLKGTGARRIVEKAKDLELVLIDLVDERRGFWRFLDGTTMTNSLEVEACGAAREARRSGARLIEFGTDEHYAAWKAGFELLIAELKAAGLWERTILLDIEWAGAVDGAPHPQNDGIARLGRGWRRLQRGAREAGRDISNGRGVGEAWQSLRTVKPTEAEEYADRALSANADYIRYRRDAQSLTASSVVRASSDVRIARDHKWGPQPFHYRKSDYESIVRSIREKVTMNGSETP